MPEINITGKTPSNSAPSGDEQYAAEYAKRFGLGKSMERFNANMMARARQEAEYQNKEFDRQKKENDRWFKTYDSAERENFRREQQQTRKWEKIYEAAAREDYSRDRARARKEDSQWNRDFVAANRENDRRNKATATASYRAMRADADQMNKLYDQTRAARSFSGQHRDFMSGHGLGRDLMGRSGLGGIGRAIGASGEMGALGVAGAAIGGGYELLKALYSAPGTLSRALDGLMATAQPYMQFQQGSADIGNAGGRNASEMRARFNDTKNVPAWMRRYGLGPNDILNIYGAYGNRGDSGSKIQSVVSASAMANQTAYLGGLGPNAYAAYLGQYETLTGASYTRPGALGPIEGGRGSTDIDPSTTAYFKKMQQAMQQATLYGLDHSKVYSTLNGMFQSQALSGAASLDIGKTAELWNRMASGGLASMRDGSGVQEALSGLSGAIGSTGYGGNSVRTMALNAYFSRHGGMPKTMGALGKLLGFDPANMSQTEKYMAENALQASQSGNVVAFETAIQPFERSNPGFFLKASAYFASQFPMDRASRDYMTGQISGIGYSAVAAYNSGSGMPSVAAPAYGSIPDSTYSAVMAAAAKTNVDPATLLALAGTESTFGKDPRAAASGGLMQITKGTFDDGQRNGYVDSNITWDQVKSNPMVNALVGAEIYKQKYAVAHATGADRYRNAIAGYNGSENDPDKAKAYWDRFSSFYDTITNANGDQNNLLAVGQRFDMNRAEQAYNTANAAFGGSSGDALISFSGNVVEASGAVAQFTSAVRDFLASSGINRGYNAAHATHAAATGNSVNRLNPGRGGRYTPAVP